jgi:hypothetical protein
MNKRFSFILFIRLVLILLLCAICLYNLFTLDWENLFISGQALLFSFIPTFLKLMFGIRTPRILQMGIVAFMFSTLLLGEVADFYEKFWWWDLILHTLAGIAFGLIGYIILILTYRSQNVTLAPVFTSVFAISFSLAASTVWEIAEFGADSFLGTNMQPSAGDTMLDLTVGLVGAIISAVGSFHYIHRKKKVGLGQIIHEGVIKNI